MSDVLKKRPATADTATGLTARMSVVCRSPAMCFSSSQSVPFLSKEIRLQVVVLDDISDAQAGSSSTLTDPKCLRVRFPFLLSAINADEPSGMVHPCGSGAFGYFECTQDVSDLTVRHLDAAISTMVQLTIYTLESRLSEQSRGEDARVYAILHRDFGSGVPRRGPQSSWLRHQILHHGGQLRSCRA